MRRRRPTSPSNEAVAVVPFFTPDPHGAAMFAGLVDGTLGQLGSRPIVAGAKYHGWAQNPQAPMTGAHNTNGSGRPVVPPTNTLDRQAAYAPDSIQALFAAQSVERRLR